MVNLTMHNQASVCVFLENVIPHLLIKRDKAIECLEYLKDRKDKRGDDVIAIQRQGNRAWNDSEIVMMIGLFEQGYSNKVIGQRLNRTTISVGKKLYKLQKKRPRMKG